MTNAARDRMELLQRVLEEQFEEYTGRLTELMMGSGDSGEAGPDAPACARAASSRYVLADIAYALRRMAEGSYGMCERCGDAIPVDRLEIMPRARYCSPCESRAPDGGPTFGRPQEVFRAQ